MAIDGKVIIKVETNADVASKSFTKLSKGITKSDKSAKKLNKSSVALGKTFGRYFAAGSLVAGLTKSIKLWNKQEQAVAQVRQGIKATGGIAKKTLSELKELASDLQSETLFGDEDILAGATAQLLTFTSIAGKEFDRTQKAVLDLATRLAATNGGAVDLTSTAIQLGKALNDPVANLGALGRSGILFTKDQKDLIKSLFETGKVAEAQRVLLSELEKQYGGSAKAAARAGTGGITQFNNALNDVTEVLGKQLGEPLAALGASLKDNKKEFEDTKEAVAFLGEAFVLLGSLIDIFLINPLRAATAATQEFGQFAGGVFGRLELGAGVNDAFKESFDDAGNYIDGFEKKTEKKLKNIGKRVGDLFLSEDSEEKIKEKGKVIGTVAAVALTNGFEKKLKENEDETLLDILTKDLGLLEDKIKDALLVDVTNPALPALIESYAELATQIDSVNESFGNLVDGADSANESIVDIAETTNKGISDAVSDGILKPLKEGENAFERLRNIAINALDSISSKLLSSGLEDLIGGKDGTGGIGSLFSTLVSGIAAGFGGAGGSKGGIINNPGQPVKGFASGGVIPNGDDQLIGAKTGEMMLTKGMQKNVWDAVNGKSGGNATNINITPPAGFEAQTVKKPNDETDVFFKRVSSVLRSPRSDQAFNEASFRQSRAGIQTV